MSLAWAKLGCTVRNTVRRSSNQLYTAVSTKAVLHELNSVSGRKSINVRVCFVFVCHDEMPLASIKQQLVTITHNSFRHRRVRFYTFVGQPS